MYRRRVFSVKHCRECRSEEFLEYGIGDCISKCMTKTVLYRTSGKKKIHHQRTSLPLIQVHCPQATNLTQDDGRASQSKTNTAPKPGEGRRRLQAQTQVLFQLAVLASGDPSKPTTSQASGVGQGTRRMRFLLYPDIWLADRVLRASALLQHVSAGC